MHSRNLDHLLNSVFSTWHISQQTKVVGDAIGYVIHAQHFCFGDAIVRRSPTDRFHWRRHWCTRPCPIGSVLQLKWLTASNCVYMDTYHLGVPYDT